MKASDRFRRTAESAHIVPRVEIFVLRMIDETGAIVVRTTAKNSDVTVHLFECPEGRINRSEYDYLMAIVSQQLLAEVLTPGGVQLTLF